MAQVPCWRQRVIGALGSYWIYQHLGNLATNERAGDMLLSALRDTEGDGGALLDAFAERSYHQPGGTKFSYVRDFGPTRFVMLDSRCGRLLNPGERAMMDDVGWKWLVEQATGQYEHLVIGTSLPRVGEKVRQGIDLEHWAAFRRSFEAVAHLVIDLAAGRYGRPPSTRSSARRSAIH